MDRLHVFLSSPGDVSRERQLAREVLDQLESERACRDASRYRSWTYVPPAIQHPLAAKCGLKDGVPAPQSRALRISGVKRR